MAAAAKIRSIRDDTWKDGFLLRERPNEYVQDGLRRKEILDLMLRDFDYYA